MSDNYLPNCLDSVCENNSSCTIEQVTTLQAGFQGECQKKIQQVPSLQIAYLSNVRSQHTANISLILNPVCLSWCDFLILFYRFNGGAFNISASNGFACAINFNAQTYENTTNKHIQFNLGQLVKQAWADKCDTLIDHLPIKTNIELNKNVFSTRSLLNSVTSNSLTIDQAIETLLNNGEIAPSDSTNSAIANFVIQYSYYFKPLDICVVMNFVYNTKIPCYKNINMCDNWCPTYSKDSNCRSCLDTTDEDNYISKFIGHNSDSDTQSIASSEQDSISQAASASLHLSDIVSKSSSAVETSDCSSRW
jgi:hypothetical protein